jgi:hypothetical protein
MFLFTRSSDRFETLSDAENSGYGVGKSAEHKRSITAPLASLTCPDSPAIRPMRRRPPLLMGHKVPFALGDFRGTGIGGCAWLGVLHASRFHRYGRQWLRGRDGSFQGSTNLPRRLNPFIEQRLGGSSTRIIDDQRPSQTQRNHHDQGRTQKVAKDHDPGAAHRGKLRRREREKPSSSWKRQRVHRVPDNRHCDACIKQKPSAPKRAGLLLHSLLFC